MLNMVKKNQDKEYWPRLTSEKHKNPHIQADWSKWVDEDEEEEEEKGMPGDWDPSQMNNFNMGDMGAMGEGDSDDDEEEEETKPEDSTKKANADLADLDAEATTNAWADINGFSFKKLS